MDFQTMMMQNPQLLRALGMGASGGGPMAQPGAAAAMQPPAPGGMMGAPPMPQPPGMAAGAPPQPGVMPGAASAPPNPPATGGMMQPHPTPHITMPGPTTAPTRPQPGVMPGPGGTNRSVPGAMPSPAPQPQPGSNPNMPGDSGRGGNEPTGENPQQAAPQNALPSFPRNRFGAMLLPQGQIGGQGGPAPNPTGAFDWSSMGQNFLQRQPGMMPPGLGGM